MPVKIKPTSTIVANLGLEPNGRVQKYFTQRCRVHMDKYVPMDDGNLRKNVTQGEDYIRYNSPYARYQYYGIRGDGTHQVKHYTTPGSGTYWDKRMWTAEGDIVTQEVQSYIRRR